MGLRDGQQEFFAEQAPISHSLDLLARIAMDRWIVLRNALRCRDRLGGLLDQFISHGQGSEQSAGGEADLGGIDDQGLTDGKESDRPWSFVRDWRHAGFFVDPQAQHIHFDPHLGNVRVLRRPQLLAMGRDEKVAHSQTGDYAQTAKCRPQKWTCPPPEWQQPDHQASRRQKQGDSRPALKAYPAITNPNPISTVWGRSNQK